MNADAHLQRLAELGAGTTCELGRATLDQVADLVIRLHQVTAQRAGAILGIDMMRTYEQRTDIEREGMRAAVRHVLTALVLLDIIDAPH